MNRETDLASVETSMENAKAAMELGQSLTRLRDNPDFKKLIRKTLFQDEAIRLVKLLGKPESLDPVEREVLTNQMLVISGVQLFLTKIEEQATTARDTLRADELTREELLNEG